VTGTSEPAVPGPFAFSAENIDQAKAIIAKYPPGRQASAVLLLLHLAQRQNGGWLTQGALDYVAEFLSMAPIRLYEIATFYTMFKLQPIGRHHVEVCTNLPCWLRGSDEILGACKRKLGIGAGETTADGMFTVSEVECLGACVNAPMAQIGDDYYEDLSPESMESILDALARGERPKAGSQIGRHSCEPADGLTTLTELYRDHARADKKSGGEA